MDDTSWITNNKENLQQILNIADSFYTLNNIQVNKSKSELLLLLPNQQTPDTIQLKFGNENISINPTPRSESIRILGVWFNTNNSRKYVKKQAYTEVSSICNTISKKLITDKHLLYIYNMVIIPRIEYKTQLTYLSKHECDSITSPFRKTFKHKLNFSISAPNAIIQNQQIYKFHDLYQVQLQSKINNFIIQINDTSILGEITDIRLKQIQTRYWLQKSPLSDWHLTKPNYRLYNNFIKSMISLCK
jgi:hypothetical protein